MKKLTLSYKEEQKGMVAAVPDFIFNWIKNFDGAEIEFSDSHLKIIPVENNNSSNEKFPWLLSTDKKVEHDFVKTGQLLSNLELKDSNPFTTTFIGQFSNGWKFRFIVQTNAHQLIEKWYVQTLEKSVCIADNREGGWAIYFNLDSYTKP